MPAKADGFRACLRCPFRNSDKMLKLCLDLRGFYLKAGQFLGSRPDFMPTPYIVRPICWHGQCVVTRSNSHACQITYGMDPDLA